MRKYIIIGHMRSGTTVTHLILKGHPQVSALNDEVRVAELFGKGISSYTFGHDLEEEKNKGFVKTYNLLALLNAAPATKAAGIKCAIGTIEGARIFVERIKILFSEVNIILTVREDVLAQYASKVRAALSGKSHSWVKGTKKPPAFITVDKGMYSRYFLSANKIVNILRSLKQTNNFIEISYEKDILPGFDYSKKLYEFLKLDLIEPTWVKSEKISPPPREFITNYNEIKRIEKKILEIQRPLFSLKFLVYDFLKTVYRWGTRQ